VGETEEWRRLEQQLGEIKEEHKRIMAVDALSSQAEQVFVSQVSLWCGSIKNHPASSAQTCAVQ